MPTVGALFTNNTGETITSLEIAYTGEHWRARHRRPGRSNRLRIQPRRHQPDDRRLECGSSARLLVADDAGPAGARDGNLPGNQAPVAAAITGLAIPPGNTFAIRWTDVNATGADDGLAMDDFTLIPHGGGAATMSISRCFRHRRPQPER